MNADVWNIFSLYYINNILFLFRKQMGLQQTQWPPIIIESIDQSVEVEPDLVND